MGDPFSSHASGEEIMAPDGDEELCAVTLAGDVENDVRVARHLSVAATEERRHRGDEPDRRDD
ncbi:MAG: hypothetical protein ACLQM8_21515 [Limisphaerales bacterium]